MIPGLPAVLLATFLAGQGSGSDQVSALIAAIDALQKPVEDFQCQFEGTIHFKGKLAEANRVGRDGLFETSSGTSIWKRGGYVRLESLVRCEGLEGSPGVGQVARHSLAVWFQEKRAEYDVLHDEDPRGVRGGGTRNLKDGHIWSEGLGKIFLIDEIKWYAADDRFELSVADGDLDGRSLRVLSVAFKGQPGTILSKYYIDLRRSGQVVRATHHSEGNALAGRLDITLASFKVGDAQIWMPVAGESTGFMALEDHHPVLMKEPQSVMRLHVVDGTMEFNKKHGLEVFRNTYKPAQPKTEGYRKLEGEYAWQQISLNPGNAELQRKYGEQSAAALGKNAQRTAASPAARFGRAAWVILALGVSVLLACALAWAIGRLR